MSSKQGQVMRWAKVVCPFFHGDNGVSIICEGCYEDSSIRQTFANGTLRKEWEELYCNEHKMYEKCPIYSIVNHKYDVQT